MQFTSPLRLEVHTFTLGEPFDLTPYVKTVSWSESTRAPWDSISAELALPLGLLLTNEIRSSNEPAVPLSPLPASLDGYLQSAGSQARGGVASIASRPQDASLAVERTVVTRPGVGVDPGLWLKLIEAPTGRALAFGRIVDSSGQHGAGGVGTVSSGTSIQAIGAMQFLRTLATEVVVALRERVGGLMDGQSWAAYMRVVEKIIKRADFGLVVGKRGLLASLAPVAIPPTLFPGITTLNELFSAAYTDETGATNAPTRVMDEVPIAGATAIASLVPNGTVADVILGIFQREPRLIELFPSLEAKTNNPLEPGYAEAKPVLVHRIAPWRTGPLSIMAVGSDGQPVGGPIQPRFERPTWSLDKALALKRHEVYRLSHRRTEDARINAVTVNWTVAGGTPARLLPMAGLPLFDRIDVLRHGAKLMELNWDMAPDQSADLVPHAVRLRTVGLLGWHFYGLGHVFRVGTIDCPYLGLRARAGEPVAVDIGHKTSPFTAYMTRVTHTATVQGSGEVSARTSIEFDRGLFDEKKRTPSYFQGPDASSQTAGAVTPGPTEEPAEPVDPLVEAGKKAIAKARELWARGIKTPPDIPFDKQKDSARRDIGLIDAMIRGLDGIGFTSETINATKPYRQGGTFEWCGAFTGTCWNAAGLRIDLLRIYFASTARLDAYAHYRAMFNTPAELAVMSAYAEADPARQRKYLAITTTTSIAEVAAWGPREGDILIVGNLDLPISDDANHIALVERFNTKTGMFECFDGNGHGVFPSGARGHGVVRSSRPLHVVAKGKNLPYRARLLIRPGYKDIGL